MQICCGRCEFRCTWTSVYYREPAPLHSCQLSTGQTSAVRFVNRSLGTYASVIDEIVWVWVAPIPLCASPADKWRNSRAIFSSSLLHVLALRRSDLRPEICSFSAKMSIFSEHRGYFERFFEFFLAARNISTRVISLYIDTNSERYRAEHRRLYTRSVMPQGSAGLIHLSRCSNFGLDWHT